jgi:hypothetical protein
MNRKPAEIEIEIESTLSTQCDSVTEYMTSVKIIVEY